ncbi:MAG: hypothetical protein MUD00_00970 [Candidatus Pacebacteria bacterium]|jgi:hypothetical protein|nr:hypothetical protein [Candidatus Paceibacterota bacterium]
MNEKERTQLDKLLNALVPFAQKMLIQHGEFYPFGMYLNSKDEIVAVENDFLEKHPTPKEVIDSLMQSFQVKKQEHDLHAFGIAFNANLYAGNTDGAISIHLEDAENKVISATLPYKKNESGEIMYKEMEFGNGENIVIG